MSAENPVPDLTGAGEKIIFHNCLTVKNMVQSHTDIFAVAERTVEWFFLQTYLLIHFIDDFTHKSAVAGTPAVNRLFDIAYDEQTEWRFVVGTVKN